MEPREKYRGDNFRYIKPKDMPPEELPGWDPKAPEKPVSRLPRALILGFAKCGTTALVTFLPLHPQIVTVDWEVKYFCDIHYFCYDLKWYRQMMPPSVYRQITIEKSPCYIMDRVYMERMKAFNSSIKLIIALRNPVDLLISKYAQKQAADKVFGREGKQLEELLLNKDGDLQTEYIKKWAVYVQYVKEAYDLFPKNQILIVDGDGLIADPLTQLRKIEIFLGIEHYFSEKDIYFNKERGFYCYMDRNTKERNCLGTSKGRKHETLNPKLNASLHKYLKPFNEQLYKLVGKTFNWD